MSSNAEYGREFQSDVILAFAFDTAFFMASGEMLTVRDFDFVPHRLVFGTMRRHVDVFKEAPAAGSFRHEVADEIKAVREGEEDPIVDEVSEADEREALELADHVAEALRTPDKSGTNYWRSKLPGFVANQRINRMDGESMSLLEQAQEARRIADDADAIGNAGTVEILMDDDYDVDADFSEESGLEKGLRVGTGIWPFDRRMGGGGLLKGQVGAISAPTGTGKSVIMTNIAANMALNGYYSLFISLEDKVETVRNRYAAIIGNFDASYTQEPKPKWPESLKREYRFVYSKESPVRNMCAIVNGSGVSPNCRAIENMIETWQNALRDRGIPDERIVGVFVDYVSRVSHAGLPGIRRDPNSYERELAIMDELTRIAERRRVILWTAVQANRDAMKKNNVDKSGVANSVGALFPCAAAFGVTVPKKDGETDSSTMGDDAPYDVRTGDSSRITRCDRKLRVNVIKMREAATENQVFYVYQGPSLRIWTNDQDARNAEKWLRDNNRAEMYAVMRG